MASESDNDDLHGEIKIVTIRVFSSHEIAQLAASNLEAHGIQCWITSDDGGGMMPYLTAPGGVRLSVRAADAETAIALLNGQILDISNSSESASDVSSDKLSENKNPSVPIGMIMGIIVLLILLYASTDKNKIRTSTHYHYAKNGKADEEWIYRDGQLVEFLVDRNLDGAWDEWTYYDHGVAVRTEYDNNFDGKVDEWWTFSDDGTDTLQKDDDFNGIPDEFCVFKNRIIQQMDMKPNGSKFTTTREIFQNGVLTEILRGGDSNGNFKEDVHYDPFFNPILINIHRISTNIPTTFQLLSPSSK